MGLKASKQKADITTPSKEKKVKRRKSKKESVTANGDTGIEEVGIQEKKDDSVILPEAQPTNGEVKSPEVENKEKGDAEKKAETDSAGSGDAPTDIVEDSPDKETNQVAQLSDVKSPTEPPPPVAATEPSTADKSDAVQPSPAEETKSEQVSSPSEVKPEEPKSEPVVAASEAKPDAITVTPPTPEVTRPELASSSISDVKSEPTTTPVQGKSETVSSAATEETKSEPKTAVGAKPEPVPEPAVATPEEVKSEPVATPSEVKPEAVAAVPEEKKSEEVAAAEPTATSEETKQEPVVEPIVPAKQEEKPEPVATTPEEIKPEPAVEPPVTTPEETKPEPKSETAVSMPEETKQEPVTESPVTPEETKQESVIEPAVATSEETKQELVTEPAAAAPEEVKSEPVAEQTVSTPEEPKPEAAAAMSDVASEHTPVETKTESPVDKKEEPKQLPETPELERLEQETSLSAEKSDVQVNGVTETVKDSAAHKEMAEEKKKASVVLPEAQPTNGEVKSPEVENKEKGDAEKKAETDSAGSGDAPTDIVEDSPDKETNQVAQLSDVKSPTEPPLLVTATEPSTAEKSEQVSSPSEVKPEDPKSEPVKPEDPKSEPVVALSEAKPDSITVMPSTPEVTRPELASPSISDVKSEPAATPVQEKLETVSSAASGETKSDPNATVEAKPEPVPEPAVATPSEVKPEAKKSEEIAAPPKETKQEAAAEPTAIYEETKQEPVVEPTVAAKQEEMPEPVATTPEEIKPEPAVEPPVTTPEETKPEPKSETAVSMPEETKQEPVTESPVTPEETKQESVIEPAVATSEETKQELVTEPAAAATPGEVKSEPVAEQPISTPEEPKPEATAAVSDVASEHTPVETKIESPVGKKEEPKQLPETPELERLEQETSQSAEKSDVPVNGVTETVQDSEPYKEMATEDVTVNGQVPESSPAEIATLISWKHGGQEVAVCGDFNKWEDNCTLIEQDGIFSTKIKLTKGQHHLKFLVDGKWTVDENEPVAELEGHGQVNVLTVS